MSVPGITVPTQFLTFHLGKEVFAIDISKIKEVLEFTSLTKIPRTPEFMCGVINLRGSVVPVVDLRLKFGMPKSERTVNTCIIIIDVIQGDVATVIGAMADSVKEVMELDPGQIEPPPKIGTGMRTDFMRGMGKQSDHFVILLDTDKVFSSSELSMLQDAGAHGGGKGLAENDKAA
ncbi:MAG: CheW protein [Magnetococcales bacterium]|nr:CheW protein [Magnetococcales bacterium]HIJ84691.1 chemotaxis protein CheW [Magnetococcales bacterium]